MSALQQAIDKITGQQPSERAPVWMVGEQLKDILRHEPHFAEIVLQDLEVPEMSLENCEKQIKAFADKNKKGGFSCVIPAEADRIIREFYGLSVPENSMPATKKGVVVDLADFF